MRICTTVVLLACSCLVFASAGQPPKDEPRKKAVPAGKAVNGLQLSLAADTAEIIFKDGKIARPAALKLTFSNVSDKPIRFNAYDFRWSRIKGDVKASPADAVTILRLAADRKLRPPAAGDFFNIKPGQSWSPGDQLAFPGSFPENVGAKRVFQAVKPGEFRVRFRYSSDRIDDPLANGIWTGVLDSNEVVITAGK